MEEFKKCPVVMLPTSGASVIGLNEDGKLMFSKELGFGEGLFDVKNNFRHRPQHIYVVDEYNDAVDGDWAMRLFDQTIVKINSQSDHKHYNHYKIIATTDPKLDLPKLTDLLLTDFHMNGVPKEIMVEYEDGEAKMCYLSSIITKKADQKTWNYDDVRLIATRFAHQCRLKGITTNNDTVNLFDEWAHNNIYFKP